MAWAVKRKTVIFFGLVVLQALFLWGLIYFSAQTRYEHFSDFGIVENFSLPAEPNEDCAKLSDPIDGGINQLGSPGFFWSESAFHFRTTLMYAVDWHQNPRVLENDQWQEFPDGINAWSEYSILMEPVLGFLYKWISGSSQNLIQFLMVVLPLFHVLLLFLIFYLAKILSGRFRFALLSVGVFSTCSLTFSPIVGSLYVKETFSWLLFSIFLIGHFFYLNTKQNRWLLIGGVGLFLFLISWHLAQFLMIPIVIVGALSLSWNPIFSEDIPNSPEKKKNNCSVSIIQPAIYLLVFFVAGLAPWLRERWFIAGLPSLLLGAWLTLPVIFSFLPSLSKTRKMRLLWMVGSLGLAICLWLFQNHFINDYSHVSGLLWHRIINGFQKPVDPGEIPFAVRVFWVPPFSSPRWLALKAGLGANGVLLLLATIWTMVQSFRSKISQYERSIIWCTLLFFLAFIFAERLAPIFVLFGSISVSLLGIHIEKAIPGKRFRKFVFPVMLLFPVFTLFYSMGGMIQLSAAKLRGETPSSSRLDKEWDSARSSLFQWIRGNTSGPGSSTPGECSSFVGEVGMSPQLLLYTGRPTVLNSQFENKHIRSRYLEYLTVLFSETENDLVEFSQKYQVDYVFINRDWATANGKNSPKYLAGKSGQTSLRSNISRFHFFPSELEFFQPVFENKIYRVFKFCEEGTGDLPKDWNRVYDRWWDLANFSSTAGYLSNTSKDRRNLLHLDNMFRHIPQNLGQVYNPIEQSLSQKHPEFRVSLKALQEKLAYSRFNIAVNGESATSSRNIKKLELTTQDRLNEISPRTGLTLQNELLSILNGSAVGFPGVLKEILPFECSPDEYSIVGEILVLLGEFEVAGEFFGKGGAVFPKPAPTAAVEGLRPREAQELLWEKTVLYLIAGGKLAKGRGLARFCATHVSPGSPRQQFFGEASGIVLEK